MHRLLTTALGVTVLVGGLAGVAGAQAPARFVFSTGGSLAAEDAARAERGFRAGLADAGVRLLPPVDAGARGNAGGGRREPQAGARFIAAAEAYGIGRSVLLSATVSEVSTSRVVARGTARSAVATVADSATALGRRVGRAATP